MKAEVPIVDSFKFPDSSLPPSAVYGRGMLQFQGAMQGNQPFELSVKNGSRQEYINVFEPRNGKKSTRALVVKMHDDDEGLVLRTIKKLIDKGVDVTYITVTNGDGRPVNNYTAEEMLIKRRSEGVIVASKIGAKGYINLGYQDMGVRQQSGEIIQSLTQYFRIIDPHIVITLSPDDHHTDHRNGASEVVSEALYRARNNIDVINGISLAQERPALYYMTPQSLQVKGKRYEPDIYIKINRDEESLLEDNFLPYETQYPTKDDLWEFNARAHSLGRTVRWKGAEALTQEKDGAFVSKENPIAQILDRKDVIERRSKRYSLRRALAFYRRLQPIFEM